MFWRSASVYDQVVSLFLLFAAAAAAAAAATTTTTTTTTACSYEAKRVGVSSNHLCACFAHISPFERFQVEQIEVVVHGLFGKVYAS